MAASDLMVRMPKYTADAEMLPLWGARIMRARVALGLKQKDLAAETDVGFKTLSNWEHGHAPPSQWFLAKFEAIYSIGPDYILCGKMNSLPADVACQIRAMDGK